MYYKALKSYCNLEILVIVFVILKTPNVTSNNQKQHGVIYILLWSSLTDPPFVYWEPKHKSLKSNNCTFNNCYIVKERDFFEDVTDYDAIMINVAGLKFNQQDLPSARSDNQLYVFVAMEPAAYWSLLEDTFNYFFNYTMTYRLDSDIINPYFFVKNKRGVVVGPKINARFRNITWMKPTSDSIIAKLSNKTKAAAWFVTNCYDRNQRLSFGYRIKEALSQYNLTADIIGLCGLNICGKSQNWLCVDKIEKSYYFYFAFENSNCEDYVTEKVMTALTHYTVPVVYGGANYSRFLPAGTYIDANNLTEKEVAYKINEAIRDKQKYYDYFRWHHHYKYVPTEGGESDPLCTLCALLNDGSVRNQRRSYAHFTKWWNEYRSPNEVEDFIVSYEESGSYIKSIVTYREKKIEPEIVETPSTLTEVNSFVGDIVTYFFGE